MSPAPAAQGIPSKRANNSDESTSTKHRRHYHRKHQLNVKQAIDPDAAPVIPVEDIIQQQLERAIDLVLQAVGYSHAEPTALASLRALAEEYMAHFLAEVRISMNSSRRVQPLPHDFLAALNKHSLTLRSLLIHLDPPVPATKLQPPLSAESDNKQTGEHEAQLIHQMLSQATLNSEPHVPRNFPSLPSRHTFKAEAVFATPHRDQKQIRELATEEGRLGEEALRRLMSKKASGDDTLMTGLRTGSKLSFRQRSRALWRETYEEAVKRSRAEAMDLDGQDQDSDASSHLRPAVNADSAYWRKPIARKITETIPTDS